VLESPSPLAVSIRVLVVDDQELLRTAFRAVIDAEDDMEVVGEAADGAEAVGLATTTSPDVVVMDVRMPVMDGIEATRRITSSRPDQPPRVLVLTTFDLDEYVFEAMRAGASGFVLKSRPLEELPERDPGRRRRRGPARPERHPSPGRLFRPPKRTIAEAPERP